MLAGGSQNLLPVLEMAEAAYRGSAGQLPPVGNDRLTQRGAYLAAGVGFALAEPEAIRPLYRMVGLLHRAGELDSLLQQVLDGALSLTEADFGTLQLRDPVTGSLWLVTQSGFGPEFLDYFAIVDDGSSACGRAAQKRAQAVIADVSTDAAFAPHRAIAAAAGFRAVQSTPLADYAGHVIGVVSTHFARPYLPPARTLRIMELYGDAAGEAIARRLGVPAGADLGDPVGPAVLAALLGPGDGQAPDPAITPGRSRGRDGRPGGRPGLLEEVMSQFAGDIVHRLFSVGLGLDSARGVLRDGPAADRVAAATGEVDHLIRDIRTIMFSLAADAGTQSGERSHQQPGAQQGRTADLLDWVSSSIFDIGVALQAAADPPPGSTTAPHLAEALRRLDDVVQAVRDHTFAERALPALPRTPERDGRQRVVRTADRAAELRQRMVQTARSSQMAAAGAAALLERQAELASRPQRIDFTTGIKRWRAFADQAERIADYWDAQEASPDTDEQIKDEQMEVALARPAARSQRQVRANGRETGGNRSPG